MINLHAAADSDGDLWFGVFDVSTQNHPFDPVAVATDIVMTRDVDAQRDTVESIPQSLGFPERVVLGLEESSDSFQRGLIIQLHALVAQTPR